MPIVPEAVTVNGVNYKIYDSPDVIGFREYVQPRVVQGGDIAGSSRPSRSGLTNIITWRWDDWSKGEGQRFVDVSDPDTWRRYYYNDTGSVDVLTPGQISLGYKLTQSYASGGTTYSQGPYLVNTKYDATLNPTNVGFLVNQLMFMHDDVGVGTDTWNNMGNAAADAGNMVSGPAHHMGGFIYAAYKDGTGAASSSRVKRITAADPDVANITTSPNASTTEQASANMEMPLVTDNRLYVLSDGTDKMILRQTDLTNTTLPRTHTDVYVAGGVNQECGMDANGNRVHIVAHRTGDEPRIHIWDGAKGFEFERTPIGFRMQTTPFDAARFLGKVLYLGGYFEIEGKKRSAIAFVTPNRTGTLGIIREDLEEGIAQVLCPTPRNLLLIGTGRTGTASKVFVHDAANDGISQMFDALPAGFEIVSLLQWGGVTFIGARAAAAGTAGEIRIFRSVSADTTYRYGGSTPWSRGTISSNSARYSSACRVLSSVWDFGYKEEVKLLHDLTIELEPLPASTSVTVELVDENDTIITTDVDGSTMTYSTADGTSKTWKISGVKASDNTAVTRRAKRLAIRLTLTADGSQLNTPVIQSVTLHASVLGFTKYYDVAVSLEDDTSTNRILGQSVSGEQQIANLRALIPTDPSSINVATFVAKFASGNDRHFPKGQIDTLATKAVEVEDVDIRLSEVGNGYARLRLRELVVTN